jgi:hypothetical protein
LTVPQNSGGARAGTVTIAGQVVTVTQGSPALFAKFRLIDPAQQTGETTECQFRSMTGADTTCRLESTSFTFGGNVIVSYAWTVQYTYGVVNTVTGSGSTLSFTDNCGDLTSTDDGVAQPLFVTLTVTDNLGNSATVSSGSTGQPALRVRLFTCGI